ncbi:hypothetical protein B0T18DRAFT_225264 [Schizothecium vesticola]|uniref:Uncharacterized protein n=1 Tax=Schizothecium vesticola TaxID=314040 RepID=A0AA40K059_9PEZI|nr:hypothetical protein B0T18DRAFT_225264 [Schizothecium vesticola]
MTSCCLELASSCDALEGEGTRSYAWNIEELANALEGNNGAMRSPPSRDMFSPADVGEILAHPIDQTPNAAPSMQAGKSGSRAPYFVF